MEPKWDGDVWLDKPRKGSVRREGCDGEMRGIMRWLVPNGVEKGGWKDK